MRYTDRASLRWVEVTIRRAGRQAAFRYSRYANELLTDPADVDAFWSRVETTMDGDPDLALDVWQALRALPKEERQVLFLSAVVDWPQKRIAASLRRSQARVSQLRHQALHHMRELLEEGKEHCD